MRKTHENVRIGDRWQGYCKRRIGFSAFPTLASECSDDSIGSARCRASTAPKFIERCWRVDLVDTARKIAFLDCGRGKNYRVFEARSCGASIPRKCAGREGRPGADRFGCDESTRIGVARGTVGNGGNFAATLIGTSDTGGDGGGSDPEQSWIDRGSGGEFCCDRQGDRRRTKAAEAAGLWIHRPADGRGVFGLYGIASAGRADDVRGTFGSVQHSVHRGGRT